MLKSIVYSSTLIAVASCSMFKPKELPSRYISNIEDDKVYVTEEDGEVLVTLKQTLPSNEKKNHFLIIDIDFNKIDYFNESGNYDKTAGYELSVNSENDIKCEARSRFSYQYPVKELDLNSRYILDQKQNTASNIRKEYNKIFCENNSNQISEVFVTYHFKKIGRVLFEQLQSESLSQTVNIQKEDHDIAKAYSHFTAGNQLSDKELIDYFSNKNEIQIKANTYGMQFSKELVENETIRITAQSESVPKFHRVGLVNISGNKDKIKRSFPTKEVNAYALYCTVSTNDSVKYITFSELNLSHTFSDKGKIECGINQPKKRRRLRKSKGHFAIKAEVINKELIDERFEEFSRAPQKRLDDHISGLNKEHTDKAQKTLIAARKEYTNFLSTAPLTTQIVANNAVVKANLSKNPVISFTPVKVRDNTNNKEYVHYNTVIQLEVAGVDILNDIGVLKTDEVYGDERLVQRYFIAGQKYNTLFEKLIQLTQQESVPGDDVDEMMNDIITKYQVGSATDSDTHGDYKEVEAQINGVLSSVKICAKRIKNIGTEESPIQGLVFDSLEVRYKNRDQEYSYQTFKQVSKIKEIIEETQLTELPNKVCKEVSGSIVNNIEVEE